MYNSGEFYCFLAAAALGGALFWFMFGCLIAAAFVSLELALIAPTCFLIWRDDRRMTNDQ